MIIIVINIAWNYHLLLSFLVGKNCSFFDCNYIISQNRKSVDYCARKLCNKGSEKGRVTEWLYKHALFKSMSHVAMKKGV